MGYKEKEPGLLTYLPSSYQEDAREEKGPLRALVKIFDYFFSGIEKKIDNIDIYFDPCMAPVEPDESGQDFLSWLATWVCLVLDDIWSEKKKRKLIKNAANLYKSRGTPIPCRFVALRSGRPKAYKNKLSKLQTALPAL